MPVYQYEVYNFLNSIVQTFYNETEAIEYAKKHSHKQVVKVEYINSCGRQPVWEAELKRQQSFYVVNSFTFEEAWAYSSYRTYFRSFGPFESITKAQEWVKDSDIKDYVITQVEAVT